MGTEAESAHGAEPRHPAGPGALTAVRARRVGRRLRLVKEEAAKLGPGDVPREVDAGPLEAGGADFSTPLEAAAPQSAWGKLVQEDARAVEQKA